MMFRSVREARYGKGSYKCAARDKEEAQSAVETSPGVGKQGGLPGESGFRMKFCIQPFTY